MNDHVVLACSVFGTAVIILGLILHIRRSELRAWNNGRCPVCGETWYKSRETWDYTNRHGGLKCVNGHRAVLQYIKRQAPEMPAPATKELRAALDRTLSSWRIPGKGVRLDLINQARMVVHELHDEDIQDMRIAHDGDNVIRLYRTRADDVFEELCLRTGGYYRYEGPFGCGGCAVDHKMGAAEIAALFGSDRRAVAESSAT